MARQGKTKRQPKGAEPTQCRIGVCFVGGGLLGAVRSLGIMSGIEEGSQDHFSTDFPAHVFVGSRSGSLTATLLASGVPAKKIVDRVRDPEAFGIDVGNRMKVQAGHVWSLAQRLIRTLWKRGKVLLRDPFAALSEDEIQMILESLPSGFLSTPEYESALNRIFWAQGLPRHFSECAIGLRILSWDLDRGDLLALGSPGKTGVSVTRAIAAASTLAGIFCPTPILGTAAVEVPPGCVPHMDVARAAGANALVVVVPSAPARLRPEERDRVSDRGLAAVWNQNQRELIRQGVALAVEQHRLHHPEIPVVLLEAPAPRPKQLMSTVASAQARINAIAEGYSVGLEAISKGGAVHTLLSEMVQGTKR